MDFSIPPIRNVVDLIPHQIGLLANQTKKLIKGLPVILPHRMIGNGKHIVLLKKPNARKILTAYKKGKGLKLSLSPDEIHHSIHYGEGFKEWASKAFKTVKKGISKALKNPTIREAVKEGLHYGVDALGTALGGVMGNPEAGMMIADTLGKTAEEAIDKQSLKAGKKKLKDVSVQKAKEVAFKAMDENINKLPVELQPSAKTILDETYKQSMPAPTLAPAMSMGLGLKLVKGSPEAKAYMASIRARKGGKKMAKGPSMPRKKEKDMDDMRGGKILGRPRGRPKKIGGYLATTSKAYRNAMRDNYNGLVLLSTASNEPVKKFPINPRVWKSAPSEMTLSPFQRIDSPAMNSNGGGLYGNGLY